ncbi:MAG: hypothetical protein ACD_3C00074G0001 [uncultured bacterium (gcode 4)]|uniref:Uncharacterized protein n=1 Tax=uncultured bacterium (gcode 4) TaxID=1234023 RepID=K2GXY8_9BACT|nr:MAG: hypothetical protein ACD_3C00074G0001 [uncultured bacterium (gcode 4)]
MFILKKPNSNAFTLVELIVVIVILAILATIAFLSFSSQSASSRDSTRLSDMSNISKWLWVFNAVSWKYPIPDSFISLTTSWSLVWYQWKAWSSVLNIIKLSWWKDPLDNGFYTYSTNSSQSKFQILWFLEDGNNVSLSYLPSAFAADYSKRLPLTKWDILWILLSSGTLDPVENKLSPTFTWIDVVNDWTWKYITQLSASERISDTLLSKNSAWLMGYWDMETLNWNLMKDMSWNWNDATCYNSGSNVSCSDIENAFKFVGGKVGKWLFLYNLNSDNSQTKNYLFTNWTSLSLTWTFSIDAWVYRGSNDANYFDIAGKWLPSEWAWYGYRFDYEEDQEFNWTRLLVSKASGYTKYYIWEKVDKNKWYKLSLVQNWDNTKVYINWMLKWEAITEKILYWSAANFTFWGKLYWILDEVKVYNRALSSWEIQASYIATR